MKIYKEINKTYDFEFWGGASDRVPQLTEEEFEQVLSMLEDCYPDGMTETELNDFFWFEEDTIAEWLGYENWEDLESNRE